MANTQTKRETIIQTTVTEAGELHLSFPTIKQDLYLHPDKLSSGIQQQALLHGLKQKLVDAAAISRNPETGKPASAWDKFHAVSEVFNRLIDPQGTWNAIREGGGSGTLLLRAMVRYLAGKKTGDEVKTWLDSKTDEERKALRGNKAIAAIIAEIQAEGADEELGDQLLDELTGE